MIFGSQHSEDHTLCSSPIEDERVRLHIEVQLGSSSSAAIDDVRISTQRLLENTGVAYCDGPLPFDSDSFLKAHVASISVCDVDEEAAGTMLHTRLFIWQMEPHIRSAHHLHSLLRI